MLSDRDLEEASSQAEQFRTQSEQYLKTHGDIAKKYSALLQQYKELKSDYEEARDSREKYKQLTKGQERNPFVLVLIDGDGYLFDDDLIAANNIDGGQRAAQLLSNAVQKSLRDRGLENCRIMVRIYANLAGLSKALSKHKLCGNELRSLGSFTANFNRSNELFDFNDAGDLKENADFKIRGVFRQFVDDPRCRQIYFAACHDVGYISELIPYVNNRDHITLVRNHAFHQEFAKLGLRIEDFPGVFRTSPLDASPFAKPAKPAPTNPGSYNENAPICPFYQKGVCKYGDKCRNQHRNDISDLRNGRAGPRGRSAVSSFNSSNDDESSNGRQALNFATLPSLDEIPSGCVAVNRHQHRLDPYIPPSSAEDRAAFNARHSRENRLCNSYHLNGHCTKSGQCPYDHNPLSPSLLNCLRQLAVNMPCPKRGACRLVSCPQGHICQIPDCGRRGGKSKVHCRLPMSAHINDLKAAEYVPGQSSTRGAENHLEFDDGHGSHTAGIVLPYSDSEDEEDTFGDGFGYEKWAYR